MQLKTSYIDGTNVSFHALHTSICAGRYTSLEYFALQKRSITSILDCTRHLACIPS